MAKVWAFIKGSFVILAYIAGCVILYKLAEDPPQFMRSYKFWFLVSIAYVGYQVLKKIDALEKRINYLSQEVEELKPPVRDRWHR